MTGYPIHCLPIREVEYIALGRFPGHFPDAHRHQQPLYSEHDSFLPKTSSRVQSRLFPWTLGRL